jgi:hypothetical protein
MTTSSLDPEYTRTPDRSLGKGHGIGSLGPSDTSDSGSDVQGGTGLSHEVGIGLDRGTTSDPDETSLDAGPDVGDANLDSDSDSAGSGERATAGRDDARASGTDIDTDQVVQITPARDDDAGRDSQENGSRR